MIGKNPIHIKANRLTADIVDVSAGVFTRDLFGAD